MRPYRRLLAALAALSTAEIVLRIAAPFAMALVVDHALGTTPLAGWVARGFGALGLSTERGDLLVALGLAGFGLQLLHELVVMWHGRLGVRVGQGMIRDVREQLFAHMQAWSLRHHGAMPAGDAVQRLEADTRCVDQIVMRGVFPVVFSFLTLAFMFAVLVTIDVTLAFVSLAVVPPMYIWLRYYTRRMRPHADHARSTDSRLSTRLFEAMTAIRLIKSHAREAHEQERFSDLAGDNARAWIGVGHQGTVFSIGTAALTIAGSTLVLLLGGRAVLTGGISLGTLLLVLAYLGYVYGPLSAIANTTGTMQQALASARRVRAAFDIVAETHGAEGALAADAMRGEVRFDGVSFSYGDGHRVLDEVSFSARPGEMIALVGPSGAGKTTLASLLVRFYDATEGRITIDGVHIEQFQLRSLRQKIALVLQDSIVASGTVADNIRYGRLDATDLQVEDAARAANAHDFIKHLPQGYETELGEGATRLSGGQRQRLSIARAFLKDAPILILDEPTSALDTIAELQVVDAIKRLWAGRTTFVVAHRLSTVRHADRILVMDRGRIVAQGTHEALLETSPLYRQLALQLVDPHLPQPTAHRVEGFLDRRGA
ncbi:MAG: ABC transporter ATP-binding protein [Kofleriaceae bacterium]|nr:ABC transporter ATP-binding protein [Kofleriaceae bacterium]